MPDNPHQAWRLDFARQLTQRITTFNGVRAVVVAGSVGRGFADAFSDIELPIFWDEPPHDTLRHAVIHALSGELAFSYDGPSMEDQLLIGGVQVDLWHMTLENEENVIREVLEGYSLDLSASNALDTLRSCIPLYGQEIVQAWKDRAQAYPDELAVRMLAAHIAAFSVSDLSLAFQRADPTGFFSHLVRQQQEMFLVLLALNRCYFPTFKWLYRTLALLPVKPSELEPRLRSAFKLPHAEAVKLTQGLLEETLHLVKEHFPQVDCSPALRRLRYIRPALDPDSIS